jgi:hypothetical protein
MRFEELGNIWTDDLARLSNPDKARVYYERAKQVVTKALADPAERPAALFRGRFRRAYLIEKIGSGPAVTTQNPDIKRLLADTDVALARSARSIRSPSCPVPGDQTPELRQALALIDDLRRRLDVQQGENVDLRRQLREAGWAELKLPKHGRLPW